MNNKNKKWAILGELFYKQPYFFKFGKNVYRLCVQQSDLLLPKVCTFFCFNDTRGGGLKNNKIQELVILGGGS